MKILLIGSTGQLGREIIKSSPNDIYLITPSRLEFDLNNTKECYEYILNLSPDWIINSGAFTNVEKAETEEELAYKINALGPQILAKALSKSGGKLLQISTDYVFNGQQNYPYKTDQTVSPINKYGFSKAKGEEYIQQYLPGNNQSNILRTSWLVGPDGNNFALFTGGFVGDGSDDYEMSTFKFEFYNTNETTMYTRCKFQNTIEKRHNDAYHYEGMGSFVVAKTAKMDRFYFLTNSVTAFTSYGYALYKVK